MKKYTTSLTVLSLLAAGNLYAQGPTGLQGIFTFNSETSTGTFDYIIDIGEDTLTITNPTGRFASLFAAPVVPLVLRSHNNFDITGAEATELNSSTFDFTGEESSIFGTDPGDGFYWASDTLSNDGGFNLVTLGAGPNNDPASNLNDGSFYSFIRQQVGDPSETGGNNILRTGEGSVSFTVEAVPEPSSALLVGLSAFGLLRRRR